MTKCSKINECVRLEFGVFVVSETQQFLLRLYFNLHLKVVWFHLNMHQLALSCGNRVRERKWKNRISIKLLGTN